MQFLIDAYKLSDPLESMHITQPYAANYLPIYKDVLGQKGHSGNDLRGQIGTYAFASIDGTAHVATASNGGKSVRIYTNPITHEGKEWRLDVLYYHLSEQLVQHGTRVLRGQLIALTGNTGALSTGPHLHFGVRPQVKENGKWTWYNYDNGYRGYLDPQLFLTYDPMADENLYNLAPHTLVKLEEGAGGFGWWNGEKFIVDDLAKIQASWTAANNGDIKGKIAHFKQDAWDAYPKKYNLKKELL